MRNYVVAGTADTYKIHFEALRRRIGKPGFRHFSWIDFSFTSDIYILGLKLDFVEIHLWWLLTYRARAMQSGIFPIHNRIVYFVPQQYLDEKKEKFELLRSCDVIVIPLSYDENKRVDYYRKALRLIRKTK